MSEAPPKLNDMFAGFVQYLPPILTTLISTLGNAEFVSAPGFPDKYHRSYMFVGLILPALWLASVGPKGLLNDGGFLMRVLMLLNEKWVKRWNGVCQKERRKTVTAVAFVWFSVFIMCASLLEQQWIPTQTFKAFVYTLAHAALMSGIGVFAFLAINPEGMPSANEDKCNTSAPTSTAMTPNGPSTSYKSVQPPNQ